MNSFLNVTKALADATRVRLLMATMERELSVCQLIALVRLAPSTVSKHMGILGDAGLVQVRKDGRWAYYRANQTARAAEVVKSGLAFARKMLANDETVVGDAVRIPGLPVMQIREGARPAHARRRSRAQKRGDRTVAEKRRRGA